MPPLDDVTEITLPRLPQRPPDSHKGDFGRALLIGGSRGMSGAIVLAGLAALRSGAGLVTLGVPRVVQDVVAVREPSYMTRGLPDDGANLTLPAAEEILETARAGDAVALGPGLGRTADLTEIVAQLYCNLPQPTVVDADALFALSQQPAAFSRPGGPRILTPHPGEFARLATALIGEGNGGRPAKTADYERQSAAASLARCDPSGQTIVLLKGYHTVITDGQRVAVNKTGNPGMATGGTGDTLTGIITALCCQGLSPFEAARLGAHVHGLAGDLAATDLGQISLIASDLAGYLPRAFRSLENS